MRGKAQAGFSIIEVSLFLAISGILLLVAFIGTAATIRSIRFSDSTRQLHSFMQKQYDEIINGVNTRAGQEACINSVVNTSGPDDRPGASRCLLLGKFVKFTVGTPRADIFLIVGSEPASSVDLDNTTDANLILQYNPRVVRNTQTETFSIPWGSPVFGMKRTGAVAAVDTNALIRSPRSSRILSYTFRDTGANDLVPLLSAAGSLGQKTNICLRNADNLGGTAKVVLDSTAQGQDAVKLDFNVDQPADCEV